MLPQPRKQTITINLLSDVSKSKDNHIMKFGSIDTDQISLCDCL